MFVTSLALAIELVRMTLSRERVVPHVSHVRRPLFVRLHTSQRHELTSSPLRIRLDEFDSFLNFDSILDTLGTEFGAPLLVLAESIESLGSAVLSNVGVMSLIAERLTSVVTERWLSGVMKTVLLLPPPSRVLSAAASSSWSLLNDSDDWTR